MPSFPPPWQGFVGPVALWKDVPVCTCNSKQSPPKVSKTVILEACGQKVNIEIEKLVLACVVCWFFSLCEHFEPGK